MKHSKLTAAAIALALLGAVAVDHVSGRKGAVSSAGMIGALDRPGFKGSDEELQAVTGRARDGDRAGRAQTTASGGPQGVETTASGSPQSVATTTGGNPDN